MRMGKKKILLAIAFVAIATVSGGIVSVYGMNKGSVEVKGAPQAEIVETVQPENEKMAQAETKGAVQTEKMTFSCGVSGCTEVESHTHNSCGVSGCTETGEHQHGLCGIDGCTQIGEHSHGICGIAGCTETGTHMHNGEYCYPHSADDGHAYHNCGVSGCTEVESHTHNSCGVSGCTQTREHSHERNGRGHHQSGHHGGGHH